MLKFLKDIRIWYALAGFILSVIAHEAFHAAANIGNIEKFSFFPNAFTIMEITLVSPGILTHDTEEAIAYSITALILLLTIIDVYAINDSRDKRTVRQILSQTNSTKYSKPIKSKRVSKKV